MVCRIGLAKIPVNEGLVLYCQKYLTTDEAPALYHLNIPKGKDEAQLSDKKAYGDLAYCTSYRGAISLCNICWASFYF